MLFRVDHELFLTKLASPRAWGWDALCESRPSSCEETGSREERSNLSLSPRSLIGELIRVKGHVAFYSGDLGASHCCCRLLFRFSWLPWSARHWTNLNANANHSLRLPGFCCYSNNTHKSEKNHVHWTKELISLDDAIIHTGRGKATQCFRPNLPTWVSSSSCGLARSKPVFIFWLCLSAIACYNWMIYDSIRLQ